jgi:hypothetical protein
MSSRLEKMLQATNDEKGQISNDIKQPKSPSETLLAPLPCSRGLGTLSVPYLCTYLTGRIGAAATKFHALIPCLDCCDRNSPQRDQRVGME